MVHSCYQVQTVYWYSWIRTFTVMFVLIGDNDEPSSSSLVTADVVRSNIIIVIVIVFISSP